MFHLRKCKLLSQKGYILDSIPTLLELCMQKYAAKQQYDPESVYLPNESTNHYFSADIFITY